MSVDTQTTPAPAIEPARISDLTTEFAQIVALENIVKDLTTARRGQMYDRLREQHEDTGGKSFQAKNAAGAVMAELVLTDSSETFKVTDPKAFADWVMMNFHDEVTRTYTVKPDALDALVEANPDCFDMGVAVKPTFTKGLLTAKRLTPTDEGVIDTETGLIVDGVHHTPAETATGMTTKWKNGDAGKQLAAAELLEGAAERLFSIHIAGAVAALESGQA